jgi:hypothetical protein
MRPGKLAGATLHTQVELLLEQVVQRFLQLVAGLTLEF